MKKLYFTLVLSFLISSCDNSGKASSSLKKFDPDKLDQYLLPNGDILSINTEEGGYDLLIFFENNQWSMHRRGKKMQTMANFKGKKKEQTIIDIDGDFMPDYKIVEGNKVDLILKEK